MTAVPAASPLSDDCPLEIAQVGLVDCEGRAWTLDGVPLESGLPPLDRFPVEVVNGSVTVDLTRTIDRLIPARGVHPHRPDAPSDGASDKENLMPDLGILGWIIIGLLAGALAGFFVPGRERMGCIGTMLVGIAGGLIGGFLWVNVLGQDEASGWLGALVIAVLGAILVLVLLRAMRRDA